MSSSESELAENDQESNEDRIPHSFASKKSNNTADNSDNETEKQSDYIDITAIRGELSTMSFEDLMKLKEELGSKVRGKLSTMSFEDLMKLKEELGSKVYNEAVFGTSSINKNKIAKTKTDLKRLNKNRPREMSSKRPVPLIGAEERQTNKSSTIRDPRFDEKCGDYNVKIFKENYTFINDIREKEVDELKEKLKNTTTDDEKIKIKFLIQRLENQNREEKARKLKEESMKEEIVEINKAKREGKQPHYTTKKERRTKELVQKYEELKKSGRLGKHLEKRRKKNTAKDRKKFSFD